MSDTFRTSAANCVISGDGITIGTTGAACKFKIQAHDANGAKRSSGGDAFFVHVRGSDRVRAVVKDNNDGTYDCSWKTMTSGIYKISVSLFGEQLPGSPFELYVYHPQAHAPNCEVKGNGLHETVVRQSTTFDIFFRDKLGSAAGPTDVDVFVEPTSLLPHARDKSKVVAVPQPKRFQRRASFTGGEIYAKPELSSPTTVIEEIHAKLIPLPPRDPTDSERFQQQATDRNRMLSWDSTSVNAPSPASPASPGGMPQPKRRSLGETEATEDDNAPSPAPATSPTDITLKSTSPGTYRSARSGRSFTSSLRSNRSWD